jgi:hypothetical protein
MLVMVDREQWSDLTIEAAPIMGCQWEWTDMVFLFSSHKKHLELHEQEVKCQLENEEAINSPKKRQ